MELLPQSREALDEYVTASIDDMEGLLRVIEGWAVRSVPDCVVLRASQRRVGSRGGHPQTPEGDRPGERARAGPW